MNAPNFEIVLFFIFINFFYFYPVKYNNEKRTNSSVSNLISFVGQLISLLSAIYYYGFVISIIFYIDFLSSLAFFIFTFLGSITLTSLEALLLTHKNLEKISILTIFAIIINPLLIILSFQSVINYLF